MLTSLSFIFLVGLAMAAICQRIRLPRIIGMLLTGIVLGPYVLDLLDPSILSISSELRQMALIIILVKAGLSLNLADLKKVGRPAVMLSCVPASFELLGYVLFAPMILGVNRIEAAVMGAVLAAVSPAVVVPRMVKLMETGWNKEEHSADDSGQGILRRYFCHCPVFYLFGHGPGRKRAADGFRQHSGVHCERHFAGCGSRMAVKPVL